MAKVVFMALIMYFFIVGPSFRCLLFAQSQVPPVSRVHHPFGLTPFREAMVKCSFVEFVFLSKNILSVCVRI